MATMPLSEAISEMIKTIDDFVQLAPLAFLDGSGANLSAAFPNVDGDGGNIFPAWFEEWLGAFHPSTIEIRERILSSNATKEDYLDFVTDVADFGFLLGHLVRARMSGTSATELFHIARNWRR